MTGTRVATGTRRLAISAAIITALAAALALGIGVFTPPRGGVLCTSGCIAYPYTDAAPFVAGDSVWIYPAIVMAIAFVALTASLHQLAPSGGRPAGLLAMALAVLAAGLLVGDYFVHLMVVMPSLARGEGASVAAFSMYNAHGVFIALENAGYFVMGLAFLAVAGAIDRSSRLERTIRRVFLLAGVLAVGGLIVLVALLGADLDVRYEVAAISIDYLCLALGGTLLAVRFRRPDSMHDRASPATADRDSRP